jgi:hypothetical protein
VKTEHVVPPELASYGGYAELFAYHVMPIVRARRLAEGGYALGPWAGTGFTFGEGTLVTCWHCVGGDLGEDEVYCAAVREGGLGQAHRDTLYELCDLARDANRTDLALARVGLQVEPRLVLATVPLQWGEDVVGFGFPETMEAFDPAAGEKRIETHARVFKGYVTRLFPGAYRGEAVVELAMPAPRGMSGGPLFRVQHGPAEPFECVGVVFGERIYQAPDGELRFGTAVRLDTLRQARAAATGGLPLAEHLARSPSAPRPATDL